MGYTHYWKPAKPCPPDKWKAIVDEAKRIVKATDVPLAGWDGEGKPIISIKEIRFNGAAPEDHETFALSPFDKGFRFCKTAYKPYDIVVCSILLSCHEHWPNFGLASDGTLPWEEGQVDAARKRSDYGEGWTDAVEWRKEIGLTPKFL